MLGREGTAVEINGYQVFIERRGFDDPDNAKPDFYLCFKTQESEQSFELGKLSNPEKFQQIFGIEKPL